MAQSAGYKAAAKGGIGSGKATASAKAAEASRAAQTAASTYRGYVAGSGYANPNYYIKDVRDERGNIIYGDNLTFNDQGEVVDKYGTSYGNMESAQAHANFLRSNQTQAIQDAEGAITQEAQISDLEQRKAEQAQYAAERAAQEYSGRTSEMYGEMAREQATEGATRPNYEPQSTFTSGRNNTTANRAGSTFGYREVSEFGSPTTEVAQGTTDLQKMERMLINAKIGNTEKELDSLNQQIALSDQKLKKISSFEKAKDAQKGGSGVAGGVTEQYLETSNSEYAAEKRQMDKLKTQQSQMQMVLAQQTREKEQMGSLTAAFDRNVQGISSDPAPMDSDPVVGNYGEQPAMSSAGRVEKFPGLADSVVDPDLRISDVAEDASNIKYGWGGTDPRFSWAQTRSQFNTGTESAPSLIIPGTEGEKRDEINKVFYGAIDPTQGLLTPGGTYVNIGQSGWEERTTTDELGRESTQWVRTLDPITNEPRIGAEGQVIENERDTVQALYARQFQDAWMNAEQREYYAALTGGEVSISDALTKPRTTQSYINLETGVRTTERGVGEGAVSAGNLDTWLAEQGYTGREEMRSVNWTLPRDLEPTRTPVQVPEGETYTPGFDAAYRDMMTPVEQIGPAGRSLSAEQSKELDIELDKSMDSLLVDDPNTPQLDESKGEGTFVITYQNPNNMSTSQIEVGRDDFKQNVKTLIIGGMVPMSFGYNPTPRTPPVIPPPQVGAEQPVAFGNIEGVPSMLGGAIALSQLTNLPGSQVSTGLTEEKERTDLFGNVVLMDNPATPDIDESAVYKSGNTGNFFVDQAIGFASGSTGWVENIGYTIQDVPDMIAGKETGPLKDTAIDMIIRTYTDPFESEAYKKFEKESGKQVFDMATGETKLEGFDAVAVPAAFMGTPEYQALSKEASEKNVKMIMENPGYYIGSAVSEAAGFLIPVSKSAYVVPVVKGGLKLAQQLGFTGSTVSVMKGTTSIGTRATTLALVDTSKMTSQQKVVFELGKFFEKRASPEIAKIEAQLSESLPGQVTKQISYRADDVVLDEGSRAAESIKYTGRMSADEARIVKEAADLKGATQGVEGSRVADNIDEYINVARPETLTAVRGQGFTMYGAKTPTATNVPKKIPGEVKEVFEQSGIVTKSWYSVNVIPVGSRVLQLTKVVDTLPATAMKAPDARVLPKGYRSSMDDFEYLTNQSVVKETERLDEAATFGMTRAEKAAQGIKTEEIRETEKLFWKVSKEKEGIYTAVGWTKRVDPETGMMKAVTVVDNIMIDRSVAQVAAGPLRKYLKYIEKAGKGDKEAQSAEFFKSGKIKDSDIWLKSVDADRFKKGEMGLFDFFKDTADGISKARSRWALVPGAITMPRTGRTAYLTKYTARVTEKQVFDLTGRNIDSATKFDQYLVARASLPEKAIIRSGLEPVEGTYRKVLRDDEYWIEPLAGTTTKLPEPIRYKILPRTMDTAKKMMGWADNIITDKPTSGTINDSLANILDKPPGQRTFLDKQTLQLYEQIVKIEEITVLADDGGLRVRPELVKERAKEIGLDIKFDRNYEEMIRVETDAIKRSGDNIPMSEIPAQAELNLLRRAQLKQLEDRWGYIGPSSGDKESRQFFNLAEKLILTTERKTLADDTVYQIKKQLDLSSVEDPKLKLSLEGAQTEASNAVSALKVVEKQIVLQTMNLARKDNKLLPAATVSQLKTKLQQGTGILKAQDNKWVYDPDVLADDMNYIQQKLLKSKSEREAMEASAKRLKEDIALADTQIQQQGRMVGVDDAMSGQGDTLFKVKTPQGIFAPKKPSQAQKELDEITRQLKIKESEMNAWEKENMTLFAYSAQSTVTKHQKLYGSASGVISGQSGLVKLVWETFERPKAHDKVIKKIINTYGKKGFAPDSLSRMLDKIPKGEKIGVDPGGSLYKRAYSTIEQNIESQITVYYFGKKIVASTGESAKKVQAEFPSGQKITELYDQLMKDEWLDYSRGYYKYSDQSEQAIVGRLFANIEQTVNTGVMKIQRLTRPADPMAGTPPRFGVGYDTIQMNKDDLKRYFDESYSWKIDKNTGEVVTDDAIAEQKRNITKIWKDTVSDKELKKMLKEVDDDYETRRGGRYTVFEPESIGFMTHPRTGEPFLQMKGGKIVEKKFDVGGALYATSTSNTRENVSKYIAILQKLQYASVEYITPKVSISTAKKTPARVLKQQERTTKQLQSIYGSMSKFKQISNQLKGYQQATDEILAFTKDETPFITLSKQRDELVAMQDRIARTTDASVPISEEAIRRSYDEAISARATLNKQLTETNAKIEGSRITENSLKLKIKKTQDALDRNIVNVDDLPVSTGKIVKFDLFQLEPTTNMPGQPKGTGRELGIKVPEGVTEVIEKNPATKGLFGKVEVIPGTTVPKGQRLMASLTGVKMKEEGASTFLWKNPNAYKVEEFQYAKTAYKPTEAIIEWAPTKLEAPIVTGFRGKPLETFSDLFRAPDTVPGIMRGIPIGTFISKLLTGTPKDKKYLQMALRETLKIKQKPTDVSFVAEPGEAIQMNAQAVELMKVIAKRDDPLYEVGKSKGETLSWIETKRIQSQINKLFKESKELDPNTTFKYDIDKMKSTVDEQGNVVNILDPSDILQEFDSTKRVQNQIRNAMNNMFEPDQGFVGGTAGPNWRTGWKKRDTWKEAQDKAQERTRQTTGGDFSDPNARVTREGLEEILDESPTKVEENPYISKDPDVSEEAQSKYYESIKRKKLPYTGYPGDSYVGGFIDYGSRWGVIGGPAMAGSPAPTMPPIIPPAFGDSITTPIQMNIPTVNIANNLGQLPIGAVNVSSGLLSSQWQAGLQTSRLDFNFKTGNLLRDITKPSLKQTQALRPMMSMKTLEAFAPVIKPKMRPKMGLPPVLIPPYLDPYDKRRRPKKKKAKKRKKKKIWWDVPDSPFKPFSAKEYKVFTGAEPGRITRLERRRFPFENWG